MADQDSGGTSESQPVRAQNEQTGRRRACREQTGDNDKRAHTPHVPGLSAFRVGSVAQPEVSYLLSILPDGPRETPLQRARGRCLAPAGIRARNERVLSPTGKQRLSGGTSGQDEGDRLPSHR